MIKAYFYLYLFLLIQLFSNQFEPELAILIFRKFQDQISYSKFRKEKKKKCFILPAV